MATAEMAADSMLAKIMKLGTKDYTAPSKEEVMHFLEFSYHLFKDQPMCINVQPPVTIVSDIHGQFNDLIRLFHSAGFPPKTSYLFLGDYIDRGTHSLETMLLLFAIKLKFPLHIVLLRGNHETALVNRIYGFHSDCVQRYGSDHIFQAFNEVFTVMPLSAIVGNRIICMHGGLSKDLVDTSNLYQTLNEIVRPLRDPPNPSMPLDVMWADPHAAAMGFKYSVRGVSCTFGPDVIRKFCDKHKIDLIVRGHQVVQDGYEFFCDRKLVTLFSAPHYCGQFDNAAAYMVVSDKLRCTFKILRPIFPPGRAKK